jgi:hypothetical protein
MSVVNLLQTRRNHRILSQEARRTLEVLLKVQEILRILRLHYLLTMEMPGRILRRVQVSLWIQRQNRPKTMEMPVCILQELEVSLKNSRKTFLRKLEKLVDRLHQTRVNPVTIFQ